MAMRTPALVFAVLLLHATLVRADPIAGLFNTGVDGSGTVLPVGTADPHYSMTGPVSGARVITKNALWATPSAGSAWIGPANADTSHPSGLYTYLLSFDLTGFDPATASIGGQWATDNDAIIYLNGVSTGQSKGVLGYTSLAPFGIASGFVAGQNTLEFRVTNSVAGTGIINPTGLLVAGLTGSATRVPEPVSALLFATGLVLVATLRRRRASLPGA